MKNNYSIDPSEDIIRIWCFSMDPLFNITARANNAIWFGELQSCII